MSSELDLLRQCITKLEAEKSKLEARNTKLLKWAMEKKTKHKAENVELKAKIEKLKKNH